MLYRLLNGIFKKREESAAKLKPKSDDPEGDGTVKPFLDHLEDLRWTAIKMAATLVVAMIGAFVFHNELFHFFQYPLRAAGYNPKETLQYLTVGGPMMRAITVSFYSGLVISLPILIYFLGQFVLPALTRKEKKFILPGIFIGFLLFLAGASFCFFQIMPRMLHWLIDFGNDSQIRSNFDVKDYLGTISHVCIAFGLLCELPVVMIILNGIGIVDYKWLAGTRAYAVAGAFVVTAIISPTSDLVTLFLLAGPIILLYEACIWIVWYLDRRRAALDAANEARLNRPYDDKPPEEPID